MRGEGSIKVHVLHRVLLVTISVAFIMCSLSMVNKSYALNSIGVGIRKDGQLRAAIGERIEYQVTIFNLGDYRVENITITDLFPNRTSKVWPIPYLSPQGQPGDSLNVSHISYTVELSDLIFPNSGTPYIVNHAEVVGYAAVQGLGLFVHAETNFPTFITTTPVGGYTVDAKIISAQNPITVQLFLSSLGLVFFQTFYWLNSYWLERSIANWRRNRKFVFRRCE
jgi:uncharacterized repeat protein (TIGR01451 family)